MAAMNIRAGNATEKANLSVLLFQILVLSSWTQRHFGGTAKALEVSFGGVLVAALVMALGVLPCPSG